MVELSEPNEPNACEVDQPNVQNPNDLTTEPFHKHLKLERSHFGRLLYFIRYKALGCQLHSVSHNLLNKLCVLSNLESFLICPLVILMHNYAASAANDNPA